MANQNSLKSWIEESYDVVLNESDNSDVFTLDFIFENNTKSSCDSEDNDNINFDNNSASRKLSTCRASKKSRSRRTHISMCQTCINGTVETDGENSLSE